MFGCYFCSTAPTLISPMRRAKLCPTCCHLASNVFKKVSLNCLVVMVREVRKHQLSYAAIVPTAVVDRQFWSFTLHIVYVSFCLWQFRFFWQMNKPRKTYEHLQNRHTIMVSFSAYCRLSEWQEGHREDQNGCHLSSNVPFLNNSRKKTKGNRAPADPDSSGKRLLQQKWCITDLSVVACRKYRWYLKNKSKKLQFIQL